MDQTYKKIILAMDPQHSAIAAVETVANLAKQHNAKVIVVDTVRPPSKSSLFFSSSAEDVFEMVIADKNERIRKTRNRFQEIGIEAEGKLLFGKTSEAIIGKAIECEADLVVRYMKGVDSRYPGLFGNTARNLMRACPCALLFVANQPLKNPKILACINAEHDADENTEILRESAKLATGKKDLSAIYCWDIPGQQFLKPYFTEDMLAETLRESETVYRKFFDQFCEKHVTQNFRGKMHFEHGEASVLIPRICQQESIDVVVMSSASQTHPVRRLLGSTIESVLDQLPCALMVVKQAGFQSPIKPSADHTETSAAS